MAVTVEEARAKVLDSILHTGTTTFSESKLDRAIIASVNRFLRETRLSRKTHSISISDGVISYSMATLAAAGTDLEARVGVAHVASTDWERVKYTDYNNIRHRHEKESADGKPELIGFDGDNMIVYPTPDAAYTLTVQTYELQDVSSWTIGGTDGTTLAVTLDVPDRWVDDVLWFGARGYLLFGAPGHVDASAAMAEFTRVLIPKARGDTLRSIDPIPRQNSDPYVIREEL
jgi:hypothetical protein